MNGCVFGKGNSYYSYYYESGEGVRRNNAEEEANTPKLVPAKPQQASAQQRSVQQTQAALQPQYQCTHVPGPGDTAIYQLLAEQSRASRGNCSYPRYDDEEY